MASYEPISVDTVANVDVNIVELFKGKIIASDLRLVASRIYIKRVLPGPGHVTYSRAVTLSPFSGADPLGCINRYMCRK